MKQPDTVEEIKAHINTRTLARMTKTQTAKLITDLVRLHTGSEPPFLVRAADVRRLDSRRVRFVVRVTAKGKSSVTFDFQRSEFNRLVIASWHAAVDALAASGALPAAFH